MVAVSARTESNTLVGMFTEWPLAMSTAMVSPNPRPTPSSTAATSPLRDAGNTTRKITCQRVAPSASAASRYPSGTAFNASSAIVVMIGAAMRPRMMPEFRMLRPTGTSNVSMMSGFMMLSPMNPHTTEGIAASISTSTLRISRFLPVANSAM